MILSAPNEFTASIRRYQGMDSTRGWSTTRTALAMFNPTSRAALMRLIQGILQRPQPYLVPRLLLQPRLPQRLPHKLLLKAKLNSEAMICLPVILALSRISHGFTGSAVSGGPNPFV